MNYQNKILKDLSVFLATSALAVGGFFIFQEQVLAVGPSPGEVIINEFVSNGDEWVELLNTSENDLSLSEFKLSELTTPQGVPTEILLLNLSGTIPAHGILVFDVSGLNNPGDSIALYNGEIDPANLWQRVTYGTVTDHLTTSGLETEPEEDESGSFDGESWIITDEPTKGYNNSGVITFLNVGEIYPFTSVQDGIDAVSDGGTVKVASGEYEENLEVDKALTLLGDPGDEDVGPGDDAPIIIDADCDRVISIEANNVKIKGFVLRGEDCRPVVRVDQGVGGTEISDNEIQRGRKGVDLSPESSENTVTKNLIYDNDDEGVWIGGSTNNTISDNEIYENGTGIGLGEGGSCDEECGDISGNEITGNHIYENEDGESGIHVEGENVSFSELTIRDNHITENGGYGIYFDGVVDSTLTISENEINNNNGAGVYISGDSGRISASTVSLENNTISNNSHEGIYIERVDDESAVTFRDNIIDGNYYGIYIGETDGESTVTIGEGNTIKNNDNAGIYLGESVLGVTIIGNTIRNNGIESETTGIVVLSASGNEAHNNTITGNGSHGVGNDDEGIFDAERNWWGDVTGPFHDPQNLGGEGNAVSDNVAFDPWYINAGRTILSSAVSGDTLTASGDGDVILNEPDDSGDAHLPDGITNLVLNNEANLDLSDDLNDDGTVTLRSGVDGKPIVLTNSDLDDVTVSIPDNTFIEGPDGWDGKIQPPVAGTPDGNAPAGFSVGDTVISIGSSDGTLVFDKPVTIVLAGVTGTVGYRPAGSDTWVEITNVCGGTYDDPEDPVSPGECSISNGTDTKIVTFHFTTFGSLDPISSPTPVSISSPRSSSRAGGFSRSIGGGQVLGAFTTGNQNQIETIKAQLIILIRQLIALLQAEIDAQK